MVADLVLQDTAKPASFGRFAAKVTRGPDRNEECFLVAKKQLWMMIQGLQMGAPATLLPNLIHIEHSLKRPFDLAEGAKSADGQKIDIAAHVESDQASGKVKIVFSKLGWSPGYAGATELLIGPNEHRVLRLPVVQEGDGEQKETIVAISTAPEKTDKDGHSRFEVGGI